MMANYIFCSLIFLYKLQIAIHVESRQLDDWTPSGAWDGFGEDDPFPVGR